MIISARLTQMPRLVMASMLDAVSWINLRVLMMPSTLLLAQQTMTIMLSMAKLRFITTPLCRIKQHDQFRHRGDSQRWIGV